jgi:thioesterase domain-containing protein/acyl carrier protein
LKPETVTEEKIREIFSEQLDIESIGVEDNYFDLGGDSITAVRIMQQIEKVFGRKIPISMLYKYYSIRKLSNEITKQLFDIASSSIIPIREEGNKEPVFFIHDMGGSVLLYCNIIKKLDKGYPVYGIQSNYNVDIEIQNDGIEKISNIYIENILKVSNQKRIVLIGFSFGGILAFEMARQLKRLGHKTCLIILDTDMSSIYCKMFPEKYRMIGIFNWFKWIFPYFFRSVFEIFKTGNFKCFNICISRIKFEVIYNLIEIKKIAGIQNLEQAHIISENVKINYNLAQKYYPEIYLGNLFLIQCKNETKGELMNKTKTNFFQPFVAGRIIKKQVNANHSNMLNSPYVEEITDVINSFLVSDSE